MLLGRHGAPRGRAVAGGPGLEPRLPGSKGRRAADYPIPHQRPDRAAAPRMARPRDAVPPGSLGALAAGGPHPTVPSTYGWRRLRFRNRPGDARRRPAPSVPRGRSPAWRPLVRSRTHPADGARPRPADPDAGLPANALGKEKGVAEQFVAVRVRRRALPRARGRRPGAVGLGAVLARRRACSSASTCRPCSGVTVGYHRYFTHGSFKATRPLRIALASSAAWRSRARSCSGSPTTGGTTPSPTATATRTRRGATAPTAARWPRACSTPTSAGCSTAGRPTPSATPPTC